MVYRSRESIPKPSDPTHTSNDVVGRGGLCRRGAAGQPEGLACLRLAAAFQSRSPQIAVTFEPGARTAWHTHQLGQTLIVTFGHGLAQKEGGPIEDIRPGDVVWFEPGEKHWHGASPTTAMQHIAINEALDGKAVDWMEKASDEQYNNKG